jgi:hypothetical protein
MPRHTVKYDHPTSQVKDIQFYARRTRPITPNVANMMMTSGFLLLKAMKSDPPDMDGLRQAAARMEEAFRTWRRQHGGPGRGRPEDEGRRSKSARKQNSDQGSQPGEDSAERRE